MCRCMSGIIKRAVIPRPKTEVYVAGHFKLYVSGFNVTESFVYTGTLLNGTSSYS